MTFRTKVTLVSISATAGLILAVSGVVYPRASREQLEGVRNTVKGIAVTGALFIDGDAHQKIPPNLSALNLPAYEELQARLRQVLGSNPGLRYVWTMVPTMAPGSMLFVGDVGGSSPQPGRLYDASHIPALLEGLEEPAADRSPVKDPWGVSISGYAPIRNKAGKTVAILGVDVYSEQLYLFRKQFQRFLGLALIAGILLAIGMGGIVARWIAHPLDLLIHGMRRVAKGELTHQVTLHTGDEFEEAAADFNRMTSGLRAAREELRAAFLNTIQSLTSALEAKDPYTRGHSVSVTQYATEIAKVMGKSRAEIETISRLAVLHDIGKIGIHDNVLQKPGAFTEEERKEMQHHPAIGGKILAPLGLTDEELSVIVCHHEREDGMGYPKGLAHTQISDLAAIVTVADSYDAMTSNRPYRKAMKPVDAIKELRRCAGTQFRPEVVEALAFVLQTTGTL